ncbi:MAG TPA: hypothetical protein VGE52_18295 [Pirellulales bacterium]
MLRPLAQPTLRSALWPMVALVAWLAPSFCEASLVWSPDGRWLAFTERQAAPAVAPGWLFTSPPAKPKPTPIAGPSATAPSPPLVGPMPSPPAAASTNAAPAKSGTGSPATSSRWRIWIASADGRDVRLAVDSARPIDGLAWHPWEPSLAYIRIGEPLPAEMGKPLGELWQVVLHHGTGRPEQIIFSERIPKSGVPRSPSAYGLRWRPDGSALAAVIGDSLVVLDPQSGEVRGRRAYGATPVWSPTGDRLAFQQPTGSREWTLAIGDPTFQNVENRRSNPRRTAPPVWHEEGDLWRISLTSDGREGEPTGTAIVRLAPGAEPDEVFRLSFADPPADLILGGRPPRPKAEFDGAWLAAVERNRLLLLVRLTHRPTRFLEFDLVDPERPRHFAPIDPALRVSELALSPDGRRIATRAGRADDGCPLIYDRDDRRTVLLAASPSLRLASLRALAEAVESLQAKSAPAGIAAPFLARGASVPVSPTTTDSPKPIIALPQSPAESRRPASDDDAPSPYRVPRLLAAAAPLLSEDALATEPTSAAFGSSPAEAISLTPAERRALDELRLFFAFADAAPAAEDIWQSAFQRLTAAPRSDEELARLLTLDAQRLLKQRRPHLATVRLAEAEDALNQSVERRTIRPEDAAAIEMHIDAARTQIQRSR